MLARIRNASIVKLLVRRVAQAVPVVFLVSFITFALIDFSGVDDPDWGEREAKRLDESFRAGAKGLKVWKDLGLSDKLA